MGVAAERQRDPPLRRLMKALRVVGQEHDGGVLGTAEESPVHVVAPRPGIVDAGQVERLAVTRERDALVPQHADTPLRKEGDERLSVAEVVVVPHRDEYASRGGQLAYDPRDVLVELRSARDEIAGHDGDVRTARVCSRGPPRTPALRCVRADV